VVEKFGSKKIHCRQSQFDPNPPNLCWKKVKIFGDNVSVLFCSVLSRDRTANAISIFGVAFFVILCLKDNVISKCLELDFWSGFRLFSSFGVLVCQSLGFDWCREWLVVIGCWLKGFSGCVCMGNVCFVVIFSVLDF